MSYIDFQKGTGRYSSKEEIEQKLRENIEKQESKWKEKEREKLRSQLKTENQWMLPSLSDKLEGDKRKKHKKEKKKKSKKEKHKKKKKSRYSDESDDSSTSGSEDKKRKPDSKDSSVKRDDWMMLDSLIFKGTEIKKEKKPKETNRCIIEKPGQSDRELNPYWKDGGCGLPQQEKDLGLTQSSVGDGGLDWLKRSLQRAKETAKEKGIPLEEVVKERWGSLSKLESLIAEAESKHRRKDDSYKRHYDRSRHNERYDKRPKFMKPSDDCTYQNRYEITERTKHRNWMKKPETSESPRREIPSTSKPKEQKVEKVEKEDKKVEKVQKKILTDEELNALAAKVIKAEILGDKTLTEKLKHELEEARKNRTEAINNAGNVNNKAEETIILTRTNERGMTVPVERTTLKEPTGGRRKKEKVTTHDKGNRIRYFGDDDKYSLQEMFEKEKLSSRDEEKEMFLKLSRKKQTGNISDEDDQFLEAARYRESDFKKDEKERAKSIKENQSKQKSLEGCKWCFENKNRLKHLIVSIGSKCYLCLPNEESLTKGHCLIVPIHHTMCGTLLDEDVWEEMQMFRKKLCDMFGEIDQEPVFFENARSFKRFPHMVLNCVPIEKEVGDLAPIYFKKALLESETEWSHNKKVVDLANKDVRRCIPKGLPYFAVNFGKSEGFAHVIEDEQLFPSNFAQEIIGGMLDLDHRKWRKHQKENFNAQRDKVLEFAKMWKKYDFTKRKDNSSSSSSSSSSDSEQSD